MSADDVILTEVSDRVAVVTLNRPDARNALNPALTAALPEAITECDTRDDVDAIVLTGADPAFCAGVDLKSLSTDREVRRVVASDADALIRPFPETTKPVIGAVNGAAVTGGFEVALTCDFLVASERARFADTHARVGIMPGWGLTVLLAEAIGHRRAREMSVTGNFLDAQTALVWGW
jgi:enoyl-CoA hydratase